MFDVGQGHIAQTTEIRLYAARAARDADHIRISQSCGGHAGPGLSGQDRNTVFAVGSLAAVILATIPSEGLDTGLKRPHVQGLDRGARLILDDHRHRIGAAGHAQTKFGQALGELKYVASLRPQGKVWRDMALCLFYMREKEKAIATLLEAIKLEPNEYLNYAIGGLIYSNGADWENARNQFTKALEVNSESALVLIGRGWCEKQLHRNQAALADFRKVLELNNVFWMQDLARRSSTILTTKKGDR